MYTQFRIAVILLTSGLVPPIYAQTSATTVDSAQQTARDFEKLTILQAELTEQKQIAADLQQSRAVHLANDNKTELDKTESRLEEVVGNIAQLQQEIDVAQGKAKAVKTVVVKPVATAKPDEAKSGQPQAAISAGPWWDLYNRQNPAPK
jgi:hypothetical protein